MHCSDIRMMKPNAIACSTFLFLGWVAFSIVLLCVDSQISEREGSVCYSLRLLL